MNIYGDDFSGNLNGTFINNTASDDGGAIYILGDVSGNLAGTFINNTAYDGGGAIYISGDNVSGNLNGIFINNTAKYGGGGALLIIGDVSSNLNGIFINNTANEKGGAIDINGSFSGNLTGTFINNTGAWAGAIDINTKDESYLTVIRNSIFINNNNGTIHINSGGISISICLENTGGNIIVYAYDKTYNATIVNGNATVIAQGVTVNITSYFGDKKYTYTTVLISLQKPDAIIYAPDVTKYYKGSERFVVTVKDKDNNPITGAEVKIHLNGQTYTKTTDNNGETSIAINLNSGVYNVTTEYDGTKVYSTVTIKDTIIAKDVTKIFRNGTQYQGTFVDSQGNLVKNTDIRININGVFYTRTTDANGMAQMNINLPPGTYILTATNPSTGEQHTTTVTVLPNIVENYDLTKYYKNASQYSLRLLDDKGNPVGAGVSIQLNINGVFYTRTSDANGYVKMNINLPPGTYIITAEYKGLRMSNTIKVLTVLEAKDLVMKYHDGSQFKAKVLDGQGRPYAGQTVTYNINGVFYTKISGDDGIAGLTINLPAGEYIITSTYNGLNVANKVTIIG